jgi:hypothetical protein
MKTKYNLIRSYLLVAVLLLPAVAQAQFNYMILNGSAYITGYTGPDGSVDIPDTLSGSLVKGIGSYSFQGKSGVTSVTIPDTVTNIGNQAFMSCANLTNATIGNGVVIIGNSAFQYCSNLAKITIPNSVTLIADFAFRDCSSLAVVTLGTNIITIGQ